MGEHGKDIFFNKTKTIQNILLIFGIPSWNVCLNIMLKFHMDIPNRLEDIKQNLKKWCLESSKLPVTDETFSKIISQTYYSFNIFEIIFENGSSVTGNFEDSRHHFFRFLLNIFQTVWDIHMKF